jgi:hypothetical protein
LRARAFGTLAFALLGTPLLAQSTLPPAEQYKFLVAYYYWKPTLTSQVRSSTTAVHGDLLDAKQDLGITDTSTFQIFAVVQLGLGQRLRGSYTKVDYSGNTFAPRPFTFNGVSYGMNNQVLTTIKGAYYQAAYENDFIKRSTGYLGFTIGGELWSGTTSITAPEFGLASAADVSVPVPTVGLTGRVYQGKFSFGGDASGLTIGDRGTAYDLNGAVQFHISDHLALEGGYRYVHINGQDNLNFLYFHQSGWHFGAELSI